MINALDVTFTAADGVHGIQVQAMDSKTFVLIFLEKGSAISKIEIDKATAIRLQQALSMIVNMAQISG